MDHSYKIEGNTFILRPLLESDIELVRQWRNKDHIRKWFINRDLIQSDQQRKWYQSYLQKDNDIMFIIEEKNELSKPVGSVALYNIDLKSKVAEFGRLMIGEDDAKGKGLGEKVTKAVCEFGFIQLELSKVYLEVFEDNKRASRIYEKIGFRFKGTIGNKDVKLEKMILER